MLLCLEETWLRGFGSDAVLFYFESKVVSDQEASEWLGTSRSAPVSEVKRQNRFSLRQTGPLPNR